MNNDIEIKSLCLECKKEHHEEFNRFFCSEICEKRWDARYYWKIEHTFKSYKGAICPLCEHEHEAIEWTALYDENLNDFKCENCGKVFSLTPSLSWSWETQPHDSDYEE